MEKSYTDQLEAKIKFLKSEKERLEKLAMSLELENRSLQIEIDSLNKNIKDNGRFWD